MPRQGTVYHMEVGEMKAFKAGSISHPFSSLISKEYKGIAGLPDKNNMLRDNRLRITWQRHFWLIWQLCRFLPKSNSANYLNRFRLHLLAIHKADVAGFFLRLADIEGAMF